MFIGHLAVGFAGPRVAPRVTLGPSILAALLADLLWPAFLLLGWEEVRVAPGATRVAPLDFVRYPWSHSLLALAGWGTLLALAHLRRTADRRGAAWLWVAVVSHWLLDAVAHRPDLPLAPGGAFRVGLGLWDSLAGTVLLEGGGFALAVWAYRRATRPVGRRGTVALGSLVGLASIIYVASLAGPPPPGPRAIALAGLASWLWPVWGGWVSRTRAPAAGH